MPAEPRPVTRYYLVLMRAQQVIDAEEWIDPVLKWSIDTTGIGTSPRPSTSSRPASRRTSGARPRRRRPRMNQLARINSAGKSDRYGRTETAVAGWRRNCAGLVYISAGRHEEGIHMLREATVFEDGLAAEYGPPDIVKPTHELLGEVLLARGENAEAQKEFSRALAMAPGRSLSLLGLARAARAAGDTAVAATAEAELKKNWEGGDSGKTDLSGKYYGGNLKTES